MSFTTVGTTAGAAVQPGPDYGSGCSPQVAQSANVEAATFNQAEAISLAENSRQFTQAAAVYTVSFDSVFDGWNFTSDCSVTLTGVNVVFQAENESGFEGYIVATESPQTSQVTTVTFQPRISAMSTPVYTSNWSGYEFKGSADGANKVYEALADWSIPTISQPNSGGRCESSEGCYLSVWPGIVHCPEGGGNGCSPSGIAQGGTDSALLCSSSACGIPFAFLWYEFYPQQPQPVICNNNNINLGDSVQAYVLNQGLNGGSTLLWNILVTDNKSNQACSITGYSFNIDLPLLADFIAERPGSQGNQADLPQFNQFSISGDIDTGSNVGIYVPYSNGWYNDHAMEACYPTPPPNINLGAVNSANTFTETYNNSDCT